MSFLCVYYTKLARVSTYLMERIPEICEVDIEDMRQLEDSEEESARLGV